MKSIALVVMALCFVAVLASECLDFEGDPCKPNSGLGDILRISFGNCNAQVTPANAAKEPGVTFDRADKTKKYLLVMADPDAPSSTNPTQKWWCHWVLANIKGSSLLAGPLQGNTLITYNGPTPPANSGIHLYHLFLFEQPADVILSPGLSDLTRGKWNLPQFVVDNKLCSSLVASFQFPSEYQKSTNNDL